MYRRLKQAEREGGIERTHDIAEPRNHANDESLEHRIIAHGRRQCCDGAEHDARGRRQSAGKGEHLRIDQLYRHAHQPRGIPVQRDGPDRPAHPGAGQQRGKDQHQGRGGQDDDEVIIGNMRLADEEAALDGHRLTDWIGTEDLLKHSLQHRADADGGDDHIDLEAFAIKHLADDDPVHGDLNSPPIRIAAMMASGTGSPSAVNVE